MRKECLHIIIIGNIGEATETDIYRRDTYLPVEVGKHAVDAKYLPSSLEITAVGDRLDFAYNGVSYSLLPGKTVTDEITGSPADFGKDNDEGYGYERVYAKWRLPGQRGPLA